MENIDFLKKILTSGCEYWIAAQKEYKNYREFERAPDTIWFICLPYDLQIDINQSNDTILLKDLEKLQRTTVINIPISEDVPPFQAGVSLHNFYKGYPIKGEHAQEILKKALYLKSTNIYDYETLIPKIEPQMQP